jgi:hypothetical protein
MQNSVLETSLVAEDMIVISIENLENFIIKFGFEVEICWTP